ncbi:uncharacterized protein ACLA_083420 [Aspergillus clavatus NRRL 1]|uniref:Uncharacterized protein n=1 Tax=Aspergillus clavatus (strain ATCC 1007 / CBS 513.65 / DSM 816 / NCTC 3887 / NRRL 1 / QM 1276 / 107) TaxID=344612 RepID=A1CTL0_ASPCL|nr:uncharacterized protein ACLA_083420 [Aspergillus clavatus NRRL 1]EAW06647.1 conserved hypothetical protein [Aspergillus clavatus NRRL 1]
MADVRSLLRSELAARKGASQTTSSAGRIAKKRKVDIAEEKTRKKMRPDEVDVEPQSPTTQKPQSPSAQVIEEVEDARSIEQESAGPELPSDSELAQEQLETQSKPSEPPEAPQKVQSIDEDEWAAFERDVVAPTRMAAAPAAVAAAATISADPLSAEQLAAQQETEKKTVAQNREAEIEGEKEDAARFLEDEFDEMEQLEERIRRLKHKRDELRQKRATEDTKLVQTEATRSSGEISRQQEGQPGSKKENGANDDDEDEEDDLDDDDWDNWRFR